MISKEVQKQKSGYCPESERVISYQIQKTAEHF